jgi:hypothetical protein
VPDRGAGELERREPWVLDEGDVRLGDTAVISYAPTPGGGLMDRFCIAVPVGTRPVEGRR